MSAYYNEIDKKAATWLRELIAEGIIAPGDVDERSIIDVEPADLVGYTQCHFFAGVGGWSIAARLAGWTDDREIWSASCPCQPFSVAGKGAGAADARHLWPDFFRLVRARRPAFIVGEQVAAAVGKDWFLGVRSDLEGIGYVGRGVVVPACAVNAPHRRDRLWFVAGSSDVGDVHDARPQGHAGHELGAIGRQEPGGPVAQASGGNDGHVPNAQRERVRGSGCAALDGAPGAVQGIDGQRERVRPDAGAICLSGVGDVADTHGWHASAEREQCGRQQRLQPDHGGASAWDGARWLIGHDGKARRVEPSIPLLVDGLPARAPLLRGYGNAIVPQLAAEVIGAWMDCEGDVS